MLKSLFPAIDWPTIEYVGFDLDGTLYDEYDFIVQAYRPVALRIARAIAQSEASVHAELLRRWLEKGSSYPHIFTEALMAGGSGDGDIQLIVRACVDDFRACTPALKLAERTRFLLDVLSESRSLFLVTDGGCALQNRKIDALGLRQWFAHGRIAISGCLAPRAVKPSTSMINSLADASALVAHPEKVVFFGDRDVDQQFSERAGFAFVRVKQMQTIAPPAQTTLPNAH